MFLSGKFSPATLLAAIAMLASGCMTAEHELVADDTLLLDRANSFFARERFAQASESYNKLVNEFPDSIYRKAGLIGLADSMYKEGRFEEANLYYERFVELYPLDTLTPRAWFYFGMCHLMITSTPDRSQRESLEAIDVFTDFLRRYPDHELAPTAKWYRKQMEGMIEESKLEVARFYHRTNKNGATIARLKDFLEEYRESDKAPEGSTRRTHFRLSFLRSPVIVQPLSRKALAR